MIKSIKFVLNCQIIYTLFYSNYNKEFLSEYFATTCGEIFFFAPCSKLHVFHHQLQVRFSLPPIFF